MHDKHDINQKYGLPYEMVSCPSCSRVYGHHNTKVCNTCQECSKCCWCEERGEKQVLMSAEKFIEETEI